MLLAALPADLLQEVLSFLHVGEIAHTIAHLKQHTNRFARGRWKRRKVQNSELAGLHKFLNATFGFDTCSLPRLISNVARKSAHICFTCRQKKQIEGLCNHCFVRDNRHRLITPFAACRRMGRTSFPVTKASREPVVAVAYIPAYRFRREYEEIGWPVVQLDKWTAYLWLAGAEETAFRFRPRFNRTLYITDF